MKFGRVAKIVAGVVVVGVVAAYGVLASLDIESYRGTIIKAAEDATGRKVAIAGPMKLKISFSPAVVIEGVEISNPTWAKSPAFAKVGRAEAEIALIPALTGDYQINRLVLHDTTVNLERRKDGSATWDFAPKEDPTAMTGPAMTAKPEAAAAPAPKIAIRGIDIKNTKVNLADAMTGQTLAVEVKTLTAEASNFSDPLKLTLDMVYNGLPIGAKGALGPVNALIDNAPATVNLTVTVPGIDASANGRIGKPHEAKDMALGFSVDAKSYDRVAETFAPDLKGLPPLAIKGELQTKGQTGYRLQGGELKLADHTIYFNGTVDTGGKVPTFAFDAGADQIDVPKLLAAATGGKAEEKPAAQPAAAKGDGRVFPNDPLPLDGLRSANGEFKLGTGALILPKGVKMHDVQILATLKDGLFTYNETFGIGGGQAKAKAVLDGRDAKNVAGLDIDLETTGVNLGTIADDMNLTKMATGGPTASDVKLKARGRSVRELMANLDGTVRFDAGRAEIDNKMLQQTIGDWAMSGLVMVDSGFATRQKTVLNCAVVRFPVKSGKIDLGRGVAAETDSFNLTVVGGVNLGTEGLDLGINPEPTGPSVGITQTATGLMRVRGTLGNPSVGLDAMGTGKAALKIGAAVATGGLSLLGDALVNQASKDAHPCATARGEKPAEQPSSSSSSSTTTQQPASNNPVDSIGGAVKGLFGK